MVQSTNRSFRSEETRTKHPPKQGAWSKLQLGATTVRWLLNIWFPFVGARIHVETIAPDFRYVRVRMKQSWYNTNYVGTHFGGSLYAMTDPFYMLMLLHNLNAEGKHYIVWDKAASIEFKSPGRGTVYAEFRLTEEVLSSIKSHADERGKYEPQLQVDVVDRHGTIVATSHKTLYVRNTRVHTTTNANGKQEQTERSNAESNIQFDTQV
jgi:hypothetical protein